MSRGARFQGFCDLSAHLEVEEVEIIGAVSVTEQQGFTTCCLCWWC